MVNCTIHQNRCLMNIHVPYCKIRNKRHSLVIAKLLITCKNVKTTLKKSLQNFVNENHNWNYECKSFIKPDTVSLSTLIKKNITIISELKVILIGSVAAWTSERGQWTDLWDGRRFRHYTRALSRCRWMV